MQCPVYHRLYMRWWRKRTRERLRKLAEHRRMCMICQRKVMHGVTKDTIRQ